MAVTKITSIDTYVGASGDAKPTGVPAGSTFYETDTGKRYIWTGSAWTQFAPTAYLNAAELSGPLTVGVDGTGHDVIFYGDTTLKQFLYDASADTMFVDRGVVKEYLTVGQATLNTDYSFHVEGTSYQTGTIVTDNWFQSPYGLQSTYNQATLNIDLRVNSGTADHEIQLRVDGNPIAGFRGTGDGAGGVTDLKALLYKDTFLSDGYGLVIGHTAQVTADITPEFQVLGTAGADGSMLLGRFSADTLAPFLRILKSRGATIGSNAIVSDNDNVGGLMWLPADGVDFATQAAMFYAQVDDASPAAGDIGIAFAWEQMPGGGGALRETMRLSAAGDLNLAVGQLLIAGTQVVGARVIDARIDDAINSGDLTTDGVIDAIRDALITHGLVAAA
jgi:hypothetical protein